MTDAPEVCPQCGAPAARDEADDVATCTFCGARIVLADEEGVRHEVLVPTIRREEVEARLVSWLRRREALGKPAKVEAALVYLPFWAVPTGASVAPVPASALLVDGLAAFRFPAGDAKAFGAAAVAGGTVVPANVPVAAAGPGADRLVHLPFWEVSYDLFGRMHRAFLDAAGGQMLAVDLPPTTESRLDRLHAATLFLLFAVLWVGFRNLYALEVGKGLLLLCGAGPAVVLLARFLIHATEER